MSFVNFFKETKRELTQVTWPTKDEVIKMTSLVIIISLIVGAYVGALDFGLSKLLALVVER